MVGRLTFIATFSTLAGCPQRLHIASRGASGVWIALWAMISALFGDFGLDLWSRPYGPGPLIILKTILCYICSRTIFEKYTVPGAYSKYASGAVCISNMVLEH